MSLKHIGRIIKSKKRVAVAYRVVPGDANSCIVVPTESLMAEEHDSLMKLIESATGQEAYELAEAMSRSTLPDGSNMLGRFHTTGKLLKMSTEEVEMTPNSNSIIKLSELNEAIANQKGVSVEDLAVKDSSGKTKKSEQPEQKQDTPSESSTVADEPATTPATDVLSDEDLAKQYRSQAAALFKEAKRLRDQAEELVPTKKPAAKKKNESA